VAHSVPDLNSFIFLLVLPCFSLWHETTTITAGYKLMQGSFGSA